MQEITAFHGFVMDVTQTARAGVTGIQQVERTL